MSPSLADPVTPTAPAAGHPGRSAAAAAAAAGDDLSTLAWVEGELRRSLEQCVKALRRWLRESAQRVASDVDAVDPALLRGARAPLHQAVGALELVGQPAAAEVLRAAEAALQRLPARPRGEAPAAVEAIERAAFAVLDYVARRVAGKGVGALAMFPQYAAVQALAGVERVHPCELWSRDWRWQALEPDPGVAPRQPDDAARAEMEPLVLAAMRQPTPEVHARIGALCAGLAAGAQGQARTLWQLAAALYEGLAAGLIAPDVHVKRIASRLHALLRAAGRGQPEWPDRLARELLFFGLRARLPDPAPATPRLAALQRAWPPDDEVRADYEHPRLGAVDPARLAQARKRVATAKEAWSAAAGGESLPGPGVAESMALLAESVQQLFPDGDVLARALQAAAGRVAPGEAPAAALAMEVATSMLYLDAVLDDGELDAPALPDRVRRLAARVKAVAGGAAPPALEPWMEELYRRVSDRQTMGSVVQELRASMAEAEKQIDAYFRDPSQAALLMPVPTALTSMRGVLSVLGLDAAAHAVVAMRDEVDRLLRGGAADAAEVDASCQRLADNLGALGFLIDMLGVQPHAAKALFHFDEASGRLLSSVARGPGDAGAAAPMPSRVALDAAPSQAAARVAAAEAAASAAAAAVRAESAGIAPAASASFGGVAPLAAAGEVQVTTPAGAAGTGTVAEAPAEPAEPAAADDDAEMREVFLEEAREVIAGAHDSMTALAAAPDEVAELTTVRRAFHTLKGSSRMVGLAEFGDVAWACERLYNARLAGAARMDGALAAFTGEALQRLAEWVDAIAAGQPRPAASLELAAEADALREGRAVDRPAASLASSLAAPSTAAPVAPAAEPTALAAVPASEAPEPELAEPVAEARPEVAAGAESLASIPTRDRDEPFLPVEALETIEPVMPVEHVEVVEPVEVVDVVEAVELFAPAESDEPAESIESIESLEPLEPLEPEVALDPGETFEAVQDSARRSELPPLASMLPGLPSAADLDLSLPLALDVPPPDGASMAEAEAGAEAASPQATGAMPLASGSLGIELDLAALDAEELPAAGMPEPESPDAIDLSGGLLVDLAEPVAPDAAGAAELVLRLGDDEPLPVAEPLAATAELTDWPDLHVDEPMPDAAVDRTDALAVEAPAAEPGLEVWDLGAATEGEQPEAELQRGAELLTPDFPLDERDLPELPAAELPETELPTVELLPAEPPSAELTAAELTAAEPPAAEPPAAEPPAAELTAAEPPAAELTAADLPEDVIATGDIALADWADQAWPEAEPADARLALADEAAQVDMAAAEVDSVAAGGDETDDEVKCIGTLRIPIPLFNIFLAEADEQSRRLGIELAEWALEPARAVGETAIAMAHSLAGNSATVGHAELSALARQLEHALMRSHAVGRARGDEARLFVDAADEIRRLLHQFAAGFLKPAAGELVARLHGHERWPMPVDAIVDTYAAEAAVPAEAPTEAPTEAPAEATAEAPAIPALVPGLEPGDRAEAGGAADAADAAIDDAIDAELFPIFEEEAEELLPQLHARLADWLRHPTDRGAAAAAMRTLHTFKGGARLAGAMRLGEVAHQLESGIERLAASEDAPAAVIERLLARADGMASDFERLRLRPRATGLAAAPTAAVAAPLPAAAAEAVADADADADADAAADGAADAAADAAADGVATAADDAARDGAIADEAVAAFDRAAATRSTQADSDLVTPPHDVASTPPGSTPGATAAASPAPGLRIAAAPGTAIDWSRFLVEDGASSAPGAAPETTAAAAPAGVASVRVRAALLDRMVSEAGEVSITRARLEADARALQASLQDLTDNLERLRRQLRDLELQGETQMASRLEAAKAAAEAFDPLELDRFTRFQELTRMMAESVADVATVQRTLQRTLQSSEDELAAQARLTRALQDDLLRTRMVEFESLAERLVRVVRLAAAEAGKAARLELVGGGIEIDRGVLERMVGPFEHLLRNAVAHGIEPAAVRRAAGKPEAGSITVTVVQEGNEVAVELRDDGAGLDLARIRARAVERGLLAADARADDETLSSMIFEPGFSTAEAVSGLAGRGIGMDVVRAEVQAMGGRILTRSEPGRGTAFRLLLPLTTAVTQVVMLRFGSSQVALPSTLVEAVRRATPAQIDAAYASGTWDDGAAPMPFFWLGALLQDDGHAQAGRRSHLVVVVRSAAQRVAVHVDEVVGQQEVVVKKLGAQLARLPGLAGVTLLPSGRVATIYNPVALAAVWGDDARRRMGLAAAGDTPARESPVALGAAGVSRPPVAAPASPAPAPLVLVVDDSLTVRRVTQRLLQREGYRVVLAKDGLDALDKLAGERPAVLLTDIEMPRMDGFDLVRNLRADDRLAALPVIMITSRIAQKHRDLAASLGVEHYLGKPYAEDELLALVARHAGTDVVL